MDLEIDPAILIGLLIAYLFFRCSLKPEKFPPGPQKLPLLGGLTWFYKRKSLIHNIKDMVEDYGKICGVFIGSKPMVIIADLEMLKEVFKKDEASQRPPVQPNNESRPGWHTMVDENEGRPPGVLGSGGQYWKEIRRFMLRNLKDFGFGKSSMESMIQDELAKLCSKLKQIPEGEPVNLNRTMNVSIVNALWLILVGEKLELDDPKSNEVIRLFDELFRKSSGSVSPLVAVLPHHSMAKWPLLRTLFEYETHHNTMKATREFIEPYITEHLNTLDPENIRDFMDLMLVEIKNTTDKSAPFFGSSGYYALFNGMIDLFLAGMETTSSSLMWTFLYLIHHPDIQKKVHQELDEVVGRTRFPNLDDRQQLNYLNAVLLESLRTTSLVGAGVPHFTTKAIEVGGYIIPKDTIVFGSLYHIMNNPDEFKDAHTFNPDRFLDEDGKFIPNDKVTAFGVGKRICLGQTLADKEFYIFCAGILQQFEIAPASNIKLPSYDFDDSFPTGTIRTVPPFFVTLKNRLHS